ncbi:MAG TPA: PH domain-containing protein [Gallionellaceae bacterium]|jgi:hypothetical protein|nr:PH domain-containing protein [Gallionellaceae bacterium]HQS74725.1 PH domain-containing protein [Gallionellaceae bacterium]
MTETTLSPTTYQLVRGGRVLYIFWAIFLGFCGVFLLGTIFSDKAQAQGHGWPVYIFVGLTIILWLGFASYCVFRALKPAARVIVDASGFTYEGVLKTTWFPWEDITAIRWVYDRGGFEWLEVAVNEPEKDTHKIKLDFSGLSPDRMIFIKQIRMLAPWVEIEWR